MVASVPAVAFEEAVDDVLGVSVAMVDGNECGEAWEWVHEAPPFRLKTPRENTLLGHFAHLRELLKLQLIDLMQWCDTRDMTADGHTKGSIDRKLLLEAMSGRQEYRHEVKTYAPYRPSQSPGDARKQAPRKDER